MKSFVALVAALVALTAAATPLPRINEQGCVYLADLALVARAHAAHGVNRALSDAMVAQIYALDAHAVRRLLAEQVSDAAYRASESRSPGAFATAFLARCTQTGDVAESLGKAL